MSAGAISGAAGVGASQSQEQSKRPENNAFADLSSTEFVDIMVQELTNQNPFKPNDSSKILEQLSSLRNIESQSKLQDSLSNLVLQNQVSQASGMIGKMVEGLDAENNRISGEVTSVRVQGDKAVLELDTGKSLEMGRVERITTPEQTATTQ